LNQNIIANPDWAEELVRRRNANMVLNERRWDPRQFSKIDIFAKKCRVKIQRPLPPEFVSEYASVYRAQDEDAISLCFIIGSVLTCRNRQSSDQLDKIYSVLGPAQRIFLATV
jgi:hypothetical protein